MGMYARWHKSRKILFLGLGVLLLFGSFQSNIGTGYDSRRTGNYHHESSFAGSRADYSTNLTVMYTSTHLYFFVSVEGDFSAEPDNWDSLTILVDGNCDGAIDDFDTPRGQVRDFGMMAYAGWNFTPFESDSFGYAVLDSGNSDRDGDARSDNLMVEGLSDPGEKGFSFEASQHYGHRIYEAQLNCSYFGIDLDENTNLNLYVRVTERNDTHATPVTIGGLTGNSTIPEDVQWYPVDFSNPGGQELEVYNTTGNIPPINGTIVPGKWQGIPLRINQYNSVPRPEDSTVIYPDGEDGIVADGVSVCRIVTQITDHDETFEVKSVHANLTTLNISIPVEMYDDGTLGDAVANDHYYTCEFTVEMDYAVDVYDVDIIVFGPWGNQFNGFSDSPEINVLPVDHPPKVYDTAPEFIVLTEDQDWIYVDVDDMFYDLEGDILEYRVMGRDGDWGLEYVSDNISSGFIANFSFRVKPMPDAFLSPGVYDPVTFRASDELGSVYHTVKFSITSINDVPQLVKFEDYLEVFEDEDFTLIIKANDTKDPMDTLSLTTNMSQEVPLLEVTQNVEVDSSTNTHTFTLNFTADNSQVGEYEIMMMIEDDDISSSPSTPSQIYLNFTLKVLDTNDAPTFVNFMMNGEDYEPSSGVFFELDEEVSAEILVSVDDADLVHCQEPLSFSLSGHAPGRVSITKLNRTLAAINYTPADDFNGVESFSVIVGDGETETTHPLFIRLLPVNDPPPTIHWEIWADVMDLDGSTSIVENDNYSFSIRDRVSKEKVGETSLFDADGDVVEFGWFIVKWSDLGTLDWEGRHFTGMDVDNFIFAEETTYAIVLMCNDGNGSVQVVAQQNITVRFIHEVGDSIDTDETKSVEDEGLPLLAIFFICVGIVVVVLVLIFRRSKRKYLVLKNAQVEEDNRERKRMFGMVDEESNIPGGFEQGIQLAPGQQFMPADQGFQPPVHENAPSYSPATSGLPPQTPPASVDEMGVAQSDDDLLPVPDFSPALPATSSPVPLTPPALPPGAPSAPVTEPLALPLSSGPIDNDGELTSHSTPPLPSMPFPPVPAPGPLPSAPGAPSTPPGSLPPSTPVKPPLSSMD